MAFKMKGSTFYGSPIKRGGQPQEKTVTVGENTSKIKKDTKGEDYALIMDTSENFAKGDTIRPGNSPRIDGYIMGGNYKTKKKGNKNYEITGDVPPKK